MEAAEPRGQGPQQDPEAGPSVVQVYCVYCDLRAVQAVREPRVHSSLRSSQEGRQSKAGHYLP